ncbi:hypothetical protein EYF80_050992 [Liparis tanakae]|uniref:Uncharacterized protein n=1 Tax=Liparis tanakae TaxID=230148 RepID=A0A4Z2FD63_9TELE|nr:hypothetical protein EYF80_050992 [Liparis tanakae]
MQHDTDNKNTTKPWWKTAVKPATTGSSARPCSRISFMHASSRPATAPYGRSEGPQRIEMLSSHTVSRDANTSL